MMIVNDDSRVITKLETSLTDDARVIIYDCHMFIVQADTGIYLVEWNFIYGIHIIILWYYFTSWKEDPPYLEPPLLRQNLGAKTIWVDLTLKMTPPPLFLDPIHLSRSALFLYYISSRYSINKLLRNLTPFRQHVLLL